MTKTLTRSGRRPAGETPEREDGERSEPASSAGVSPAAALSTEVLAVANRRQFTAEYKLQVLQQADACRAPDELGELLRREGPPVGSGNSGTPLSGDSAQGAGGLGAADPGLEQQETVAQQPELKNSRYALLKNPANLTAEQFVNLSRLSQLNLKTVKAYQMRLNIQEAWTHRSARTAGRLLRE